MIFDDGAITIFSSNKKPYNGGRKGTRKSKKEINNAIFSELSKYTQDNFWIDFLDNARKNNFPKNFKCSGSYFIYKCKMTDVKMVLDNASKDKFQELKDFLFKYAGIESPDDSVIRIKNTPLEKPVEYNFNKIKLSPSLLKISLSPYLQTYAKKYNFTLDDIIAFEGAIYNKICCNQIRDIDVVIKNNVIQHINGIRVDGEQRKIIFDNKLVSFKDSEHEEHTYTLTNASSCDNEPIRFLHKRLKNTTVEKDYDNYIVKLFKIKK